MTESRAPWTDEQVAALNHEQQKGRFHPFTCANRDRDTHPRRDGERDFGLLVATPEGWICRDCDYTQGWAHDWMLGETKSSLRDKARQQGIQVSDMGQVDVLTGKRLGVEEPTDPPWTPDYGSEGPTIQGAVFQALGSASVCWENMSGTGVFQSEEAVRIGEGLLAIIAEHVAAETAALRDERDAAREAAQTYAASLASVIGPDRV